MKYFTPPPNPLPVNGEGGRNRNQTVFIVNVLLILMVMLATAIPVLAQDEQPPAPDNVVTSDDVNEVATGMFCPICENEPLDTCRANTCVMWREEIRDMLEDGMTEDQIVSNFVDRFGQRVVGVPEDDGLRFLSFAGPIAAVIAALGIGIYTFNRWRGDDIRTQATQPLVDENAPKDDYRMRLERDLLE